MDHRYNDNDTSPPTSMSNSIMQESDQEFRTQWRSKENESSNCLSCDSPFTATKWKHHCRSCGKVVCADCSNYRMKLPEYGHNERVRVCDDCYLVRSASDSRSMQEELDEKDKINKNLKKALEEKISIVDKFRTFLLELESILSLQRLYEKSNETPHIKSLDNGNFTELMQHTAEAVKSLVGVLKLKEAENQSLKKAVNILEVDFLKKSKEVNQLNQFISEAESRISYLESETAERDSTIREQVESLREYEMQISSLKQRCTFLEIEDRNRREYGINDYATAVSNSFPRCRSLISNDFNANRDSSIATSYTLSGGLDEPLNDAHCTNYRKKKSLLTTAGKICFCNRRRRVANYRTLCSIQ